LIDAIVIKVRDSQVANRPVYVAIGVNLDGERDVLGVWLGPPGGEGAKQWMTMLTELKNRGIADALIVCCDGFEGFAGRGPRDVARRGGPEVCRAHGAQQFALRVESELGTDHPTDARHLYRADRRDRRGPLRRRRDFTSRLSPTAHPATASVPTFGCRRPVVQFTQCPYDSSPVGADAYSGGSTQLSCPTCGAAWEWHNTWIRRVREPDREAVRLARAGLAQVQVPRSGDRAFARTHGAN
jgi:hypothetical protein